MSDEYYVSKETIEAPIKAIWINGIPDEYFREFEREGSPIPDTFYYVYLMASLDGDRILVGIVGSSKPNSLSDEFNIFMEVGIRETNEAGRFKAGDVPIEEIRWQFIPVDTTAPHGP